MPDLDTHHYRLQKGRHAGELITRAPQSYLRWLANTPTHDESELAQAELDRRGATLPQIDVTAHAIDRASQRLLRMWKKTREGDEGLHAWLARMATEAMLHLSRREGRLTYEGIVFEVVCEGTWPVLRSVWRDKHAGRGRG